jgi:threonine aldolase
VYDGFIDLRSDTVTRPSAEMRAAMANARVGDDVFDDDPTVHELQARAASLMGKEAALFVPTGTMGNIIALKVHTSPGDEVLMDANAHSMLYEVGNAATIAHVMTRQYRSDRGIPCVDELCAMIHEPTLHSPGTTLILLENSHNRSGGYVIPMDVHLEIYRGATARGIRLHLDGARVFNAATASGVAVADIAANTDSVTFCLSKGLGCPVGSVLCGTFEFIEKARRVRKMLGGGMRQAGILAAAGIYALEHNIQRLGDDHANARRLAAALNGAPGLRVETESPQTNMVYFRTSECGEAVIVRLKERYRVLVNTMGPNLIRAVTHLDVDESEIEPAAAAIRAACAVSG